MALLTGTVIKVGAVSGAEPVGRLWLGTDSADPTKWSVINCTSGPKLDLAMMAFQSGAVVEVDVLATTAPMVADKIRVV